MDDRSSVSAVMATRDQHRSKYLIALAWVKQGTQSALTLRQCASRSQQLIVDLDVPRIWSVILNLVVLDGMGCFRTRHLPLLR